MLKLVPTTPPWALSPPPDCGVEPVPGPNVGKVNPNGGLLLFPRRKDGRLRTRGPTRDKGWIDFSRRAAAEFFLHVGLGQPVVIDSKPSAHHPVAPSGGIPRDANPGTKQIVDLVEQRVVGRLRVAIGNLLLFRRTSP